jgi:hypothetical protein
LAATSTAQCFTLLLLLLLVLFYLSAGSPVAHKLCEPITSRSAAAATIC